MIWSSTTRLLCWTRAPPAGLPEQPPHRRRARQASDGGTRDARGVPGAAAARRLARQAAGSTTRPSPPTSPSSTTRAWRRRAPRLVVAAACFRARLTHEPSPGGERTARVLATCRGAAAVADAADGEGGPRHRQPREDEPGGRGEGRAVRRTASPAPCGRTWPPRARCSGGPGRCRSRRRWWGCGLRRRPGRPASRRG